MGQMTRASVQSAWQQNQAQVTQPLFRTISNALLLGLQMEIRMQREFPRGTAN